MYSIQLTCKVKECRSVLYAGKYEGMRYVLKPYKDMSLHSQLSLRIISLVASVWAKLRGRSMGQASAWATLEGHAGWVRPCWSQVGTKGYRTLQRPRFNASGPVLTH